MIQRSLVKPLINCDILNYRGEFLQSFVIGTNILTIAEVIVSHYEICEKHSTDLFKCKIFLVKRQRL